MWDKEKYEKEFPESDQRKKLPQPSVQKPPPKNAELVDLIPSDNFNIGKKPFIEVVNGRSSHRSYTEEPLTLEELSFLLWCTQGVSYPQLKQWAFNYGQPRYIRPTDGWPVPRGMPQDNCQWVRSPSISTVLSR